MVKPAGGFSLIELMVVIAILGVLLGVATPKYTEWVASQRVRDAASDLHASLMRARNEAITRGVSTSICAVNGNLANGWSIPNPSLNAAGTALLNPDTAAPADLTFKCTNTLSVFIEQHGPLANGTVNFYKPPSTNGISPGTLVSTHPAIEISSNGRLVGGNIAIRISSTSTSLTRCITVDTAGRPKTRVINASAVCY